MIPGRSALTPHCRAILSFIDEAGSVKERALRKRFGSHLYRRFAPLLAERGFIVCVNGMAHGLSAPPSSNVVPIRAVAA